ncbi:MAG: hypothetical protein OXE56_03730 [Gammaproteobacteria bacterium]|nr:hypothetical protein [Gammaproteobacteria bacterium]
MITSSQKAMIDKGFEQYGSDSIAVVPMIGQLPSDSREQVGGEIWAMVPGQDQISGMIEEQVQIGFPLLGIPANVLTRGVVFQAAAPNPRATTICSSDASEIPQPMVETGLENVSRHHRPYSARLAYPDASSRSTDCWSNDHTHTSAILFRSKPIPLSTLGNHPISWRVSHDRWGFCVLITPSILGSTNPTHNQLHYIFKYLTIVRS